MTRPELIEHVADIIGENSYEVRCVIDGDFETIERMKSRAIIAIKVLRRFTVEMSDFSEDIANDVITELRRE